MPRAGTLIRAHALLLILCLIAVGEPSAGEQPGQRLDHRIGAAPPPAGARPGRPVSVADTLRILAVMVEFQPDNDARPSGDGTFDLTVPVKLMKDPPPHDRPYFDLHLSFLAGYYRKVPDGKLEVSPTLLPGVYRLPSQMRAYSPGRNSRRAKAACTC